MELTGHVDFDGHGLAADQLMQPAQLVEHGREGRDHLRAIGGALGHRYRRCGCSWSGEKPGWAEVEPRRRGAETLDEFSAV